MSISKLAVILFSSFLIFATAPLAPAQNTQTQDTTKKQTTTKKGTASKDQATQNDQSTTTDQSTSKKGTQSTAGAKKTNKETTKKETTKKSSMSHERVRQVQTALKDQGFDPGPIDGIMGQMTMTAIRNYQLYNSLPDTVGVLNAETEKSLLSGASAGTNRQGGQSGYGGRSSLDNSQSSTFSSQNQTDNSADLSQNINQRSGLESSGVKSQGNVTNMQDVRQVQQSLTDLGYMPGDINGMMSSDTQEAVQQFQWMNNLPVTGHLDQTTKMAIDTQARGSLSSAELTQDRTGLTDQDNTYKQDTTSTSRTKPSRQNTYDTNAKQHDAGKYDKDAYDRATKAAEVLQNLTAASDRRIPDEILQRAEAIAVIPHMIKGAFGIGGRFGKGLVSQRNESG